MELFVGGLAYAATAPDLSAFVGAVVEPDATLVVTDRETGRSKGFGFVEVSQKALDGLVPYPGEQSDEQEEPDSGQGNGASEPARNTSDRASPRPPNDDSDERKRLATLPDGVAELIRQLDGQERLQRRIVVNPAQPQMGLRRFQDIVETPGITPDEEAFRDGLEASLSGRPVEEVMASRLEEDDGTDLRKITFVGSHLLEYLADHREALHELLNPRQFEELCYELLARTGFYDLALTRRSRDGGVDLFATRREHDASTVYVIECKYWKPDNPVGSPVVQQTFGVMGLRDAHRAMIVTSSHFTGPAREAQASSGGKIVLRNRHALGAWISACRDGAPNGMLWLPGDPAVAPTVSYSAAGAESGTQAFGRSRHDDERPLVAP